MNIIQVLAITPLAHRADHVRQTFLRLEFSPIQRCSAASLALGADNARANGCKRHR